MIKFVESECPANHVVMEICAISLCAAFMCLSESQPPERKVLSLLLRCPVGGADRGRSACTLFHRQGVHYSLRGTLFTSENCPGGHYSLVNTLFTMSRNFFWKHAESEAWRRSHAMHVTYTNIERGTKFTEGGHYSPVNNVLGDKIPRWIMSGGTIFPSEHCPRRHVKGGTSSWEPTIRCHRCQNLMDVTIIVLVSLALETNPRLTNTLNPTLPCS